MKEDISIDTVRVTERTFRMQMKIKQKKIESKCHVAFSLYSRLYSEV